MNWLFHYDVFISYSNADRAWVEGLARDLVRAGFSVFYDRSELRLGLPWRSQIEAALRNSSAGVVVLSPDAVTSGAVDAEVSALLQDAWRRKRPVIPVLYRDCEVPLLLASRQWVDFRDPRLEARAASLEQLVKGLRGEPPGPPEALSRVRWWQRPLMTLRLALLLMLLLPAIGVTARGVTSVVASRETVSRLKASQETVQPIDERVTKLIPAEITRRVEGAERRYFDPRSRQHIATDVWTGGLLRWRIFYRNGRAIARDEFRYEAGLPVEKIRLYLDDEQRIFLIDHFGQDGTLLRKRYCPQGPEGRCDVYVDLMRSPLPLPAMFYR